ncbi:hypothetical protein PMIN06_008651 [Paraphaeosphaeria minitans]|uniref:Uncharacterized protein n=1 Tax=Paraphaeosphaeria minitans TaxID=565426 RepID=A0A9P6G7C6_9PLEO|nr:hypothetical protein PMIN01_11713 [Paraphaeosphaeria minitans]
MNPQLKALLAGIDNPARIPSPELMGKIFEKYAREASGRCLGLSSWLSVVTATAVTLKSSALMIALYSHATAGKDLAESTVIAEFMRDVGISGIAVIGIPRVINMLTAFHVSLPSTVKSSITSTSSDRADASNIVTIQSKLAGSDDLRDIVDTVPFTSEAGAQLSATGIMKVVLGSVNRRLDRNSKELHK